MFLLQSLIINYVTDICDNNYDDDSNNSGNNVRNDDNKSDDNDDTGILLCVQKVLAALPGDMPRERQSVWRDMVSAAATA